MSKEIVKKKISELKWFVKDIAQHRYSQNGNRNVDSEGSERGRYRTE